MSNEVQHPLPDPARGELVDARTGAIIARLPVRTRPCWGEPDHLGRHSPDCVCFGTGQVAIKEPREAAVDAADQGLAALEDALAERDANGERLDDYMGDSIERLMQPPADGNKRTGGKSGSSKKPKPKRRRFGEEKPPSKWSDGQRELTGKPRNEADLKYEQAREKERLEREEAVEKNARGAGRKSRFPVGNRTERVSTSIDPATRDGLKILNADLASLVNIIMDEPASLAVVVQAQKAVAKEAYDAVLREAAILELRYRAGEKLPSGGIVRIRARLRRCWNEYVEAEAKCAGAGAA